MDPVHQEIPHRNLPPGFARSLDDPPSPPAEPRPAATAVLLRDGTSGPELLLVRRSRSVGFVPGAYVFPGGRVSPGDAGAHAASATTGLGAEEAARRLALPGGAHPPALAYYTAALRETFEETGILVAEDGDGRFARPGTHGALLVRLREAAAHGPPAFADALARSGLRLALHRMAYLAHWITPEVEPRRYDTRFFAIHLPPDAPGPEVDGEEIVEHLWASPEGALRRHQEGTLPMIFPTLHTVASLRGFRTATRILEAARSRPVSPILPRLHRTDRGVRIRIDEEER